MPTPLNLVDGVALTGLLPVPAIKRLLVNEEFGVLVFVLVVTAKLSLFLICGKYKNMIHYQRLWSVVQRKALLR